MAGLSTYPTNDFDAAVRLLSGGTNFVIYNDIGLPSIYVKKAKGLIKDVITTESEATHPAFIVDGSEISAFYMGKYLATVYKGRALSLPLQAPACYQIDPAHIGEADSKSVTFLNSKIWSEANGPGFHLATIAEYAWIALNARKNGTMPSGNNNYGNDKDAAWEKGIRSNGDNTSTLNGSGPARWNDNWKPDGICDLNGNVNEWEGGYRIYNGEINIFTGNDAALPYSQDSTSTYWKAIMPDGTLVDPGTAGTLKWDYVNGTPASGTSSYGFRLNTALDNPVNNDTAYGDISFGNLSTADGVLVPDIMKALALMPDGGSASSYGGDHVLMKNRGDRRAYRGGGWVNNTSAGVFFAHGSNLRTAAVSTAGFRPAFIIV